MNQIPRKDIKQLVTELEEASQNPEQWEQWHTKTDKLVTLHMPLGELLNPAIRGYIWVWDHQRKITTAPIDKRDRFAAQGIEGKAIIHDVSLVTALLIASWVGPYRIAIVS